ncbi:Solute carrier family 40 member 1, partial [Armadillidium vulgare]
AQSSLILQNSMVCACTLLLCMMTIYKTTFYESLHGWGGVLGQVGVVFLSCLAQIGTLGSKLVIEKDWIIIISEQSDTQLSTMNSVLRTVDLSTKILAPVLVGFIMTSAGMVIGGIVIGVWNLVSLCVEYGLLHKLYYDVASLQKPKQGKMQNDLEGENTSKGIKEKVKDAAFVWKSYFKHNVRDAGLGLALLYMTVLALDNFSRAYVHENGVSKEILGVLTGVASISGILGSIAYPFLRKKLGPLKTGVFGFTYQVTCLLFCLASVFAPGSPFNPHALFSCNNSTAIGDHQETSSIDFNNSLPLQYNNFTTESYNKSLYEYNATEEFYEPLNDTQTLVTEPSQGIIYTSVILLLFGIVTSRFGLWLADLTVTQILQEEVAENERCGINGVQDSLNQFFGLVRAILIIVMPTMATFGYLIILSIAFVFLATVLFAVYAKKKSKNNNPVSQPNCKSCKPLS